MKAVVVGGGPAGLMAAETLATAGAAVTVVERMPTLGRKFLMAGRGGLNLTHGEPLAALLMRYHPAAPALRAAIMAFPPERLIAWCEGLGQATFVGSSLRMFPVAMKASPLLRAWLARLAHANVRFLTRRRWTGFSTTGKILLENGEGLDANAVVLACGGASWPRLGSDGSWQAALPGCAVSPLRPANCGFRVAWSAVLRARFAGSPLKRIAVSFAGTTVRGEAMISRDGIEGGAIYALSRPVRDAIGASGHATLSIDLRPDLSRAALAERMAGRRGGQSVSAHLRKNAGLPPVAVALVQEALHAGASAADLPALIKAVPLRLDAPQPLARAISTAGGLCWGELDEAFMLRRHPGVFAAGEMLDWEAPTGGYLLQACLATGAAAGAGALSWLREQSR